MSELNDLAKFISEATGEQCEVEDILHVKRAKEQLDGSPLESVVQGTPIIAILKDELKEWREGVKYMKEHKLDFRCELASAKALERAIQRIQREARS